jgi:hypothetical protein
MSDIEKSMHGLLRIINVVESVYGKLKIMHQEKQQEAIAEKFAESVEYGHGPCKQYNSENTVLYATGDGVSMADIIKRLPKGVPYLQLESQDGKNFVAIPKHLARQVNAAFSHSAITTPKDGQEKLRTLDEREKSVITKISHESKAMAGLISGGQVTQINTSNGRGVGIQKFCQENHIPCVIHENYQNNTTSIYIRTMFTPQIKECEKELDRVRTPITRAEVAQKFTGQIVVHSGINEAEKTAFEAKVRGSGILYTTKRHPDGTYTIKYQKKDAKYLYPAMSASMVEMNGKNVEFYENKRALAEDANSRIVKGQPICVIDAQNPRNSIYTDGQNVYNSMGRPLEGPAAVAVQAKIKEMQAPILKGLNPEQQKELESGKNISDFCTEEEIMAAQASYAQAVPDAASHAAAVIAATVTTDVVADKNSNPQEWPKLISSQMSQAAKDIEANHDRKDTDERANDYGVMPENVDEIHVQADDPIAKKNEQIADELRKSTSRIANTTQIRPLNDSDITIESIGRSMEEPEQDGQDVGLPEKDVGLSEKSLM